MGKVIGLTGSIASGKSTVSNRLKIMGYQVIDCDQINHEILKKDNWKKHIGVNRDWLSDSQGNDFPHDHLYKTSDLKNITSCYKSDIPKEMIEPIQQMKVNLLSGNNPRLHTDEVLIALSMSAVTSETAKRAIAELKNLSGSEAHSTVILSQIDSDTFRKLGVNLTCEPQYQSKKLYHK